MKNKTITLTAIALVGAVLFTFASCKKKPLKGNNTTTSTIEEQTEESVETSLPYDATNVNITDRNNENTNVSQHVENTDTNKSTAPKIQTTKATTAKPQTAPTTSLKPTAETVTESPKPQTAPTTSPKPTTEPVTESPKPQIDPYAIQREVNAYIQTLDCLHPNAEPGRKIILDSSMHKGNSGWSLRTHITAPGLTSRLNERVRSEQKEGFGWMYCYYDSVEEYFYICYS